MIGSLQEVLPLLTRSSHCVLTTHVNPDGDGLGSELAMASWLSSRGTRTVILNYSPTPQVYLFLDPGRQLTVYRAEEHNALLRAADTVLILDTNAPDRLRAMKEPVMQSAALKICIDHHLDPAPFAHQYLIDEDATSTGEIVYRLLREAGGSPFTPAVATALYCAIMTDTGSFRYPRVDADIHRIVAHLIEAGADPVAIYSEVYERWSPGRMRLLGEMLERMRLDASGKLACAIITQEMLRRTGTTEDDADNFTTYPMSIAGVHVGILFLEKENGAKISFRSRGAIPVNALAQEFGGNGHMNAAGARVLDRKLETIVHDVMSAAEKYVT